MKNENKENKNLSGFYADKDIAIIGNTPTNKKITHDISDSEIQNAIEKTKRKQQKNRLIKEEMEKQLRLKHPTIAKLQPYLTIAGLIVTMTIFFFALYVIFKVQSEIHFPST
jgi:hypothetical protein